MNEELLYYIWKYQRFNTNLLTTEGIPFSVEHPGIRNSDAGPDFTNARIRIGKTLWAGNVEIHLRSSDWTSHKHHLDEAYNNIILHVVYEDDKPVFDKTGNKIATLQVKNIIDDLLVANYKNFAESKNPVPCSLSLNSVKEVIISVWLEKLAIERLQNKTEVIFNKLNLYKNDWEQSFYEVFARNFGFNVNSEPFELLAKSLPQKYFAKSKNNLFQLEALLFGQSGLLDDEFADDYPVKLRNEYQYLQKKYDLRPIEKHLWRFLRIRPNNFPTIRLAQFAGLIHRSANLFSKIIEAGTMAEIYELFDLRCSEYWQTHYVFDKSSERSPKNPGRSTINLLIINTIVPFVFAYGKIKGDDNYTERALTFLSTVPPEKNQFTEKFLQAGLKPVNAIQSQAMIHLFHEYCSNKKCLQCSIGDAVLKSGTLI
ncbi:MAG TPA: DUF2851 family protein [Bacteroidales bacterium]|nr:DUF2851 family protein [Bacteroidales bacterium]